MDGTFRTLIYSASRMEIEELVEVRRQLGKLLGHHFLEDAEKDECLVNKVVSSN